MPSTPPASEAVASSSASIPSQPASALSTLASNLDASHSDIPSFLNTLLAPLLPPSLPSQAQAQAQAQTRTTQLRPDLEPIDKSLNELLTQLSLLSQDTSSAVEQSIHDVSRTVPRLAYDLQFMRESANGLASSLSLVQDRVSRQTELGATGSIHTTGKSLFGAFKEGRKGLANGSGIDTLSGDEGAPVVEDTAAGNGDLPDGGVRLGDGAKTQRSLEKLSQLDKLKTRLESARDILREAESWSTLESELNTLIANSQYQKAGQRLHEASRSMVVFEKTPAEYEDRKRLLISLTNQLELSISKALKESLEKDDVDECALFYEVFLDMDRLDEFRKYYFNSKSTKILGKWNKANIIESISSTANTPILNTVPTLSSTELDVTALDSTTPTKLSRFLPSFYSLVLEVLNEQVENIPLIFPPESSPAVLSSFVQTTLDALDPSFSSLLSSVAEYHGSEALPELIRAYKATEELGVAIQGLIDRMTFNTQGGLLSGTLSTPGSVSGLVTSPSASTTIATSPSAHKPTGPSPSAISMARTSSKRMSVSRRFSRAPTISSASDPHDPQSGSNGSGWETTLYEPFLDLQSTYATLERRYLEHLLRVDPALQAGSFSSRGETSSTGKEFSRSLLDSTALALGKGEEAIMRCLAFTKGYGSLGLISALEAFISTFFSNSQAVLVDRLNAQSQSRGNKSTLKERDDLDFDGFPGGGLGSATGAGLGLDNSSQDWNSFQSSLHILESCQEISAKLNQYEGRLTDYLKSVSKILKASRGGEGYDQSSMTWGSILLLQQSTLNSIDLHTLISNPIPPILPISANQLSDLTKTCQLQIQSIILQPLLSQLESYPALSVWTKPDKIPKKGELVIPTFSLSPTDIISRISEGLLDLLRVFEVWSGQTGLGWSLNTLPYIDSPQAQLASDSESHTQVDTEPSPETVLSTWISSLSLTFLSHLTSITLPSIRSLTSSGQSQLSTDLGYLSNAVGALDVHWEELNRWEKALEAVKDEGAWRREMRDLRGSEGEGEEGEREREIVRKIGWMRGWV
ncbi:hypothetical protein IAT40_005164 [Kwoniella sp. CBS 6097]